MSDNIMYLECMVCKQKVLLAKSFGFWTVDLAYNGENVEDFLNAHIHGKIDDIHFSLTGGS